MLAVCPVRVAAAARARARQRAASATALRRGGFRGSAYGASPPTHASGFGAYSFDDGLDAAEEPDEAVASTLRAVRATGRQALGASQRLADTWAEALAVLLPTTVPRETVKQLTYVGVACFSLFLIKSLLSTLILAGTATLAVVCLSRWMAFQAGGADGQQPEQWDGSAEEQRPARARRRAGRPAERWQQGDLLDVWYER